MKEAADSLASQLLADEPEAANGDAGGGGGGDGLLEAPASADSRYASVVKKLFTNTETFEITEKCLKWKWICRLDDKVVRPPWYRPPLFSSVLCLVSFVCVCVCVCVCLCLCICFASLLLLIMLFVCSIALSIHCSMRSLSCLFLLNSSSFLSWFAWFRF